MPGYPYRLRSPAAVPWRPRARRRFSGGAYVAPPSGLPTSGLVGWWDASDASSFTFGTGTEVAQWNDKSGNGKHLTQGTAGSRPTRSGTLNGKSVVVYDGVDDKLTAATWSMVNQPLTIAVVFQSNTSGGAAYQAVVDATNVSVFRQPDGQLRYFGGSAEVGAAITNGQPYLATFVADGASSKQRLNSVEIGTTNTGTAGMAVLGIGAAAASTDTINGFIAEVSIWNRVLSGSEITQVESYYTSKWLVANPIVAENALTGYDSANWQVNTNGGGIGDSGALGFTTAMSVQAGSSIDFKIHTGGTNYALEIIRLGWYGGLGARKVYEVTGRTGVTQPESVQGGSGTGEGSAGSRNCSSWTVTDTWAVPADACHGVYLGVIKRVGSGTSYAHVGPFVVHTTHSATADILCKLSDMTWRAYNAMGTLAAPTGGKSLYGVGAGAFAEDNRAWSQSYDAPLTYAGGAPQTSYWNGERPLHAFLERNGFDVAYASCLDVDANASILLGHKVIVSEGHDEYWSQNVRNAWDAAINAGVNALIASGNTMLWRTRMVGRTMWCYKDTHSLNSIGAGLDPGDEWTGCWRDTRWASRNPENRSLGTMFVKNGLVSAAIVVPDTFKTEPMWRGTSVASLGTGASETLKTHSLGFEWDSYEPFYTDSMRYPAGLKLLSLTVTDQTTNACHPNGAPYATTINPANHYIVAFKKGAALVVNLGVNQWGYGLSDFHTSHSGGGSVLGENTTMKQATINVLADMGCQPGSIQSLLTTATLTAWTFPTASTMSTTATLGLTPAATGQLAATTTWSNGITTDNCDYVTWGTSDASKATVSATGLVTGVAPGTATITGTYGALSDTTSVTVTAVTTADTYTPLGYAYPGSTNEIGKNISVGAVFKKTTTPASIYVKGVRIWRSTNSQSAAPVAYLRAVGGGANLASKTSTFGSGAPSSGGWEEFLFTTPYQITSTTQEYVVWVWLPSGGYAAYGVGFFSNTDLPVSQLGLFRSRGATSSVFQDPPLGTNGDAEPNSNFNTNHYMVEPLVVETLTGNTYNETGRPIGITAAVTVPTDQVDFKDLVLPAVLSLGNITVLDTVGGGSASRLIQEGFRWRNDDGSQTTATWKAAQDTNTSLDIGTAARLRVVLDTTATPPPTNYTLYYKKSTDSTWVAVPVGPGGGSPVYVATSTNIAASGEASTAQLTPPASKTTSDFATGRVWDDENGTDSLWP